MKISGQYAYVLTAIETFLRYTPHGVAVVVDDGHSQFHKFWDSNRNVVAHCFRDQAGVTRSWNIGLIKAREMGAEYTICGNDGILFTSNWKNGPEKLQMLKEFEVSPEQIAFDKF